MRTISILIDDNAEFALLELADQFDIDSEDATVRAALNMAYMSLTGQVECLFTPLNVRYEYEEDHE